MEHLFLFSAKRGGKITKKRVTLKQVPEAVQAQIQKMAAKGRVESIELWTKGEKAAYKVEIEFPGKDVVAMIAPDGKILETRVEKDDDDNEDGGGLDIPF